MSNKIILLVNILIILFVFFLSFVFFTSGVPVVHDYFWIDDFSIFEPPVPRIPGLIFNWFFSIFLTDILNINLIDFRSFIGGIIISLIVVFIVYLFSKSFFLLSDNSVFKKKIFPLVFICSFFCMCFPLYDSSLLDKYFMEITEITTFAEYTLVFVFYFIYWNYLIKIVSIENYIFTPKEKFLVLISAFILGFWSELFSLSVFFSIFLYSIFICFYNRKIFINKNFLLMVIPFFIGIFFLIFTALSIGTLGADNSFEIFSFLQGSVSDIKAFLSALFHFLFFEKYVYLLIIFLLSLFLFVFKKVPFKIIFLVLSIFCGYFFANLMSFVACGLKFHSFYIFSCIEYNQYEIYILLYMIFVLFGFIYHKTNEIRAVLSIIFVIFIVSISCSFFPNYVLAIKNKVETKKLVYDFEKMIVIYNYLGETAILPYDLYAKYINKKSCYNGTCYIFPMNNIFTINENFRVEKIKERYFSKKYFYYSTYYDREYKNKFIGIIFKNDDICDRELKKRLELLPSSCFDEKINFTQLKELGNMRITKENIEALESRYENNLILMKAKAFYFFTNEDYLSAEKLYREYLKYYPLDFDALINLKKIYLTLNEKEMYKDCSIKLVEMDSENIFFLFDLLKIYYDEENYEECIPILDKMISACPDLSLNYINLAIVYNKLNNIEFRDKNIALAKKYDPKYVKNLNIEQMYILVDLQHFI